MAKLVKNLYLQGASGMLGGQLVYRSVNGETIVSSRPERRRTISETQKRQNTRFRYATMFAKHAIQDDVLGPIYAEAAARMIRYQNAYTLAITDYLKAPEIGDILLESGASGNTLIVEAYEQPQVAKVVVDILTEDEQVLTTGKATLTDNGIQWKFVLTQDIPEGGSVLVKAYDLPGNVTSKSFTIE